MDKRVVHCSEIGPGQVNPDRLRLARLERDRLFNLNKPQRPTAAEAVKPLPVVAPLPDTKPLPG